MGSGLGNGERYGAAANRVDVRCGLGESGGDAATGGERQGGEARGEGMGEATGERGQSERDREAEAVTFAGTGAESGANMSTSSCPTPF